MTREDAIEYLKDERSNAICDEVFTAEWVEVLDMAIESLKQEPCEDCVSRQAVKDIIHHYKNNIDCQTSYLTDGVCNLPNVKPISNLDKIKAEMHATAEMHEDGDYYLREEWIDEFFDKYKAESEDKNEI